MVREDQFDSFALLNIVRLPHATNPDNKTCASPSTARRSPATVLQGRRPPCRAQEARAAGAERAHSAELPPSDAVRTPPPLSAADARAFAAHRYASVWFSVPGSDALPMWPVVPLTSTSHPEVSTFHPGVLCKPSVKGVETRHLPVQVGGRHG